MNIYCYTAQFFSHRLKNILGEIILWLQACRSSYMCTVHFTVVSRPLMLAVPCAQNLNPQQQICTSREFMLLTASSFQVGQLHALSVEWKLSSVLHQLCHRNQMMMLCHCFQPRRVDYWGVWMLHYCHKLGKQSSMYSHTHTHTRNNRTHD